MSSKRYRRDNSIFRRIFKGIIAVIILSAFVLMISFLVKGFASFDPARFARVTKPILAKLNINEDKAGEVAGELVERISNTGINKEGTPASDEGGELTSGRSTNSDNVILYSIALMADSENDFKKLEQALEECKDNGIQKVLFLGDLTSFGEIEDLNEGRKILENSGLEYYIIPGDHDLAASDPPGSKNFMKVFDITHQVVRLGEHKIMMFDNSKNFTPLEQSDLEWFQREIDDTDIVILSQPLYHESINVVMGVVDGAEVPEVKEQAKELLNMIRGFNVKMVIAGDQHNFSVSDDPVKVGLTHYVINALLENGSRNLGGSGYAIFDIFEDGTYKITEIKLK